MWMSLMKTSLFLPAEDDDAALAERDVHNAGDAPKPAVKPAIGPAAVTVCMKSLLFMTVTRLKFAMNQYGAPAEGRSAEAGVFFGA